MKVSKATAVCAAVMLGMVAGVTAPSSAFATTAAAADSIRQKVDAYRTAHPGGVQINGNEIAYDGGKMIVTVTRPPSILASKPDCPSGWYCFYDGLDYTYPRGRLSDCGWQDLGNWGWRDRIESVFYNLSAGSVVFIEETGPTDTLLFSVNTTTRGIANVGAARNRADYVYRYCQ